MQRGEHKSMFQQPRSSTLVRRSCQRPGRLYPVHRAAEPSQASSETQQHPGPFRSPAEPIICSRLKQVSTNNPGSVISIWGQKLVSEPLKSQRLPYFFPFSSQHRAPDSLGLVFALRRESKRAGKGNKSMNRNERKKQHLLYVTDGRKMRGGKSETSFLSGSNISGGAVSTTENRRSPQQYSQLGEMLLGLFSNNHYPPKWFHWCQICVPALRFWCKCVSEGRKEE